MAPLNCSPIFYLQIKAPLSIFSPLSLFPPATLDTSDKPDVLGNTEKMAPRAAPHVRSLFHSQHTFMSAPIRRLGPPCVRLREDDCFFKMV